MNPTGMLFTCAVRDHEGAITWTRVVANDPQAAAAAAIANLALKGRCVVDVYTGDRRTPVDPKLDPVQTVTLIA